MATKKKTQKKTVNGRRKGHQFERDIANLFKKIYPDAKRHLEYQDSEANGIDIVGTDELRIQCKRGRKYSSLSAIEEIQVCPIEGGVPVLVTQGDHKEILAAMPLKYFLTLLEQLNC